MTVDKGHQKFAKSSSVKVFLNFMHKGQMQVKVGFK